MSRSWNRRIRIHLFANAASLELEQCWPRRVLATQQLLLSAPEPTTVAQVAAILQSLGWQGGIHLVLGNRWLRFAALPWPLQSGNNQRDADTAAAWLTQTMQATMPGQDIQPSANRWQVELDSARFGQPRLFAALAHEDFQSLQLLDHATHPLASWQPWAMTAWNRHCQQLPDHSGTLGIAEPGALSLVSYANGRVQAITQRTLPLDNIESLLSLLRLEELRLGKPMTLIADALPPTWQASLSAVSTVIAPCHGASSALLQAVTRPEIAS